MSKTALDLLEEDHKKVRKMLKELVETSARSTKKRQRLLEEIKTEIEVHTAIEEEIFYPAFREKGRKEEQVMYYEAKEEHRAVDKLVLPDLLKTKASGKEFSGRAKVLKELINHHASEEEEDMFPKARKLFSKSELEDLGKKMKKLKKESLAKKKAA